MMFRNVIESPLLGVLNSDWVDLYQGCYNRGNTNEADVVKGMLTKDCITLAFSNHFFDLMKISWSGFIQVQTPVIYENC